VDKCAQRVDEHRKAKHKAAFKELLSAGLVVSEEKVVKFSKINYDPSS